MMLLKLEDGENFMHVRTMLSFLALMWAATALSQSIPEVPPRTKTESLTRTVFRIGETGLQFYASPLALFSGGIHCVFLKQPTGNVNLKTGARVEVNVLDKKTRCHVLWRHMVPRSGRSGTFKEYGVGFANGGLLGTWNSSGLGIHQFGPSAYLAWGDEHQRLQRGNGRKTLGWKNQKGKGPQGFTSMWGVRLEFVSRLVPVMEPSGSTTIRRRIGLFLPLFLRFQVPLGQS